MNESMPRRVFGEYINGVSKILKPVLPKTLGIDEAHFAKNMRSIFVEIIRTPSGETKSRGLESAPNKKKAAVVEALERLDNITYKKALEAVP